MMQFLEQFLNWIAIEIVLTGLLFFSYHLWVRRLANPLDRFNVLYLSFVAILLLPWIPLPVLSESWVKSLIAGATLQSEWNPSFSISSLFPSFLLATLPLLYFLTLCIRGARILNAIKSANQIALSGTLIQIPSIYPVVQHNYPFPPMTSGIRHPKILIPSAVLSTVSPSDLSLIIQHEEEHIRRGDGLSNLLRILVREILFFSPFIWSLSNHFEDEMEISVDASILARNKNSKQVYASLLLKVVDSVHHASESIPIGAYLSKSALKRRILSMKSLPRSRSKALSILALGVFVSLGMLGVSLFGTQAYSSSSYSNRDEFYSVSPNISLEIDSLDRIGKCLMNNEIPTSTASGLCMDERRKYVKESTNSSTNR